jgi:hypothetical protein
MRLSVSLLLISLAGILGGAALIGLPALGAAVIFDSLCVGWWALHRDDGLPSVPQAHGAPTLHDVLERFRQAS